VKDASQRKYQPADSCEISEKNISFLLCQVKNRAEARNVDDVMLNPVYCGIVKSGDVCMQPYLAIRHELRASSSGHSVEKMVADIGRVGLVIYRTSSATSPCLQYRRSDNDGAIEDLLERVLTVSVQCVTMADEYSDRLVLSLGALPCQFKHSFVVVNEPTKAPLKKQR
jgi:hypothetical protein